MITSSECVNTCHDLWQKKRIKYYTMKVSGEANVNKNQTVINIHTINKNKTSHIQSNNKSAKKRYCCCCRDNSWKRESARKQKLSSTLFNKFPWLRSWVSTKQISAWLQPRTSGGVGARRQELKTLYIYIYIYVCLFLKFSSLLICT